MFTAIDELGNKVSIMNAEYGKTYYCPKCNEKVTVKKKGKVKAPHFAHKPGSDCTDWGDMSEWHLSWQEKFPEECREVILEKNGERHRADVCIKDMNLVIEFQHSTISNEEFNKRNCFYTSCGYRLVWVFDATGKIKDPNACIIPSFSGGLSRVQVFLTHELEWKRKQEAFRNFPEFLRKIGPDKITVYLETQIETYKDRNILIKVQHMDGKFITAYCTSRCIFQENFLKCYGGFAEDSCCSISEILEETKAIQNKIKQQQREMQQRQANQIAKGFLFRNSKRRRF